jgi:hypothetical protein
MSLTLDEEVTVLHRTNAHGTDLPLMMIPIFNHCATRITTGR